MNYQSQYEQDKFVDQVVFNGKRNGVFVDIGAYDGITFSNSYFFEKFRGFKGICIEPNPNAYKLLEKNRSSKNLNVCVGNTSGKVKFLCVEGYGEMLSCIYDESNTEHLARVDETIRIHGGDKRIEEIEVVTFGQIIDENLEKIDFFTIDTEGFEFEILKMIDFDKYNILALAVEVNDDAVISFLENQGYIAYFKLSCDIIFVKKSLVNPSMYFRLLKYRIQNKLRSIVRRLTKPLSSAMILV
ncbi:MAG: FkbM family methyltransferase [Chitinophagaceae bacterium]|nr:FkbM family methyltransferase [Chitinophagaceae bacterium]